MILEVVDSDEFNIIKWDVINLCNDIPSCSLCNKAAIYCKESSYYCKTHTKNTDYKIPTINKRILDKKNMKDLMEIANDNDIVFDRNISKKELIKVIEEYIDSSCLDVVTKINANDIKLIDLGINLKTELNNLFSIVDIDSIDMILLENQISPIANRMKTIQGMIAQYFIDSGNYNIEFISAANKLKLFVDKKKTSYSERKKLSIVYTEELLINKNKEKELIFFNKSKKKDDLADSFLQGIYYLNELKNGLVSSPIK